MGCSRATASFGFEMYLDLNLGSTLQLCFLGKALYPSGPQSPHLSKGAGGGTTDGIAMKIKCGDELFQICIAM